MNLHLLEFLKETSTVIIPDFGALTLTNADTGEVMFMSYLKYDDGKLIKFISEKENISIDESKEKIAQQVKEINEILNNKEIYSIPKLGKFSKDSSGEIIFESWVHADSLDERKADTISEEMNTDIEIDSIEPETVSIPPLTEEPTIIAASVPVSEESNAIDLSTEENKIPKVAPEEPQPENKEIILEETATTEYVEEAEEVKEIKKRGRKKKDLSSSISESENDITETPTPIEEIPERNISEIPEAKEEKIEAEQYTEEDQWKDDLDLPPINAKIEKPKKPILEKTQKDKKKRRPAFYFLLTFLVLIIAGTLTVAMFYNSLEEFLPFMKSEKIHEKEIVAEEKNNEIPEEEIKKNPSEDEEKEIQETVKEEPVEEVEENQVESGMIQTSTGQVDRNKPYHVIAGAFSDKSNADRYQNKLTSEGNNSVIIGQFDNLYIVSIGSYSSMAEAENSLGEAKNKSPKAWIFKWP